MTLTVQQKAEHARRLLDDPLLREMFEQVKRDAVDRFADSQSAEAHIREEAYRDIQALDRIRSALENVTLDMQLISHDQKG